MDPRAGDIVALELSYPGVQACRGRHRAMAQPEQRREAPADCPQDAAACRGSRRDRGNPSSPGWTMDLRPCRAHDISRPIDHRTGTTQPETPRGIGPRSTKPLLFKHIDRWVLGCVVVDPAPGIEGALHLSAPASGEAMTSSINSWSISGVRSARTVEPVVPSEADPNV